MEVNISGSPAPKVEWYFNGEELNDGKKYKTESDKNKHTLVISDVEQKDNGEYTVVAHNKIGRDSSKATLLIAGKYTMLFLDFSFPILRLCSYINIVLPVGFGWGAFGLQYRGYIGSNL